MAVTMFDEFDPEALDQGGMPKPGKCQLLVAAVEENEDADSPYVNITHEVIAHEDPTQIHKVTYNTFSLSGKGAKRALLFAIATGVITKQQLAEAKALGQTIDVDYKKAYGKVYYGTLVASEYQGKRKVRIEWDFKGLDDKDVDEYPFSPEFTPGRAAETKKAEKPKASKASTDNGKAKSGKIPF